jgi:hypothetical protein
VLDGPASVDGRLVVMTSNSPDALDAALLRPGRIDSKILFGYTTKEVSSQIFSHIFNKTPDEIAFDEDEKITHPSKEELLSMAEQFAACIPETKISPAECQGYLMRHRDDPHAALANAETWAAEILAVKEKGKNVADFDNEIKRGGALFAGRGNRLPPNGINGVNFTDPAGSTPNYATRYVDSTGQYTAHSRADARSMLAQCQALAEVEAEGYDSGAEEVVDMPTLRTSACMPPGDFDSHFESLGYTNGNDMDQADLIEEDRAASTA